MIERLREVQKQHGAVFDDRQVPTSFGNDAEAIAAVETSGVLCDRSHWGRLQLTDADRQTFLHNQTTNDIKSLQPGDGRDTLFVTSTARTIDLATAYILADAVMVVVSPQRRDYLMQWLDRYIFFGDKVKLTDLTPQTALFSVVGPASHRVLQQLGVEPGPNQPYGKHWAAAIAGIDLRVAVGSGLASEGYTLIVGANDAASIWEKLVQAGAIPMGDRGWEHLRIVQGRPAPDHELTEDYNAVEACVWQAISLNKGCYIGQETIARLDTYQGVKQQLWGIRLSAAIAPNTPITVAGEKVGILTSVTQTQTGYLGLGYVRTKAGQAGTKLEVGSCEAELVEVPFLQRDRQSA